jgi:LysM repeat protein
MRREHKILLLILGVVDCALAIGVWFVALRLPAQARIEPTVSASVATATPLSTPIVLVYTVLPAPTVTPLLGGGGEVGPASIMTYTVASGDTLWGLSVRFKVSLAALMAANPYANPDQLRIGQVMVIPVAALATPVPLAPAAPEVTDTPAPAAPGQPTEAGQPTESVTLTPVPTAAVLARVAANGQGLRFRRAPGTGGEVFAYLNALTPLKPLGRTPDSVWLQVTAPEGQGWVMAQWVEVFIALDTLPVQEVAVVMATETQAPLPTATRTPITPGAPTAPAATATNASVQAPPTFPPPGSYSLISGVSANAHNIFLSGQAQGNRANVFSKIGDSITANDVFLTPIGWGMYDLRQYTYLAPVIAFFSQTPARTANSFANTSLSAKTGWSAWRVLDPSATLNKDLCGPNERPLECEYRVVKPSIALIMLGTNDVQSTTAAQFEAEMRTIIQISIDHGVIPVISTIPPLHKDWAVGRVETINGIIVALAREYDIPLWDYWSALQGLPNDGLTSDGVHPSVYAGHAADFSPDYIEAGYTVRNLLALQALDAVWKAAVY